MKCDVAIVGGGFAGVSAAIEFLRTGHKVVLIEKNILGGSSSGRSAGFLTPDSELELHQLVRRYGTKAADGRLLLGAADEDYKKSFNYFSNERHFALPSGLGKVIGKPMLFSLTNSWAKFFQVDKVRSADGPEKEF